MAALRPPDCGSAFERAAVRGIATNLLRRLLFAIGSRPALHEALAQAGPDPLADCAVPTLKRRFAFERRGAGPGFSGTRFLYGMQTIFRDRQHAATTTLVDRRRVAGAIHPFSTLSRIGLFARERFLGANQLDRGSSSMVDFLQPSASGYGARRENRRYPRVSTSKAGTITSKRLADTIACILRNLSSAGGCLEVLGETTIPDEFTLTWDDGRTVRRCRVEWRDGNHVGVAFR